MTNAPLWFSNLVSWSAQVALLVLAAGLLPRLLSIRQPRVLLFYWRTILAVILLLPFLQPWHRAIPVAVVVPSINFVSVPAVAPPSPVISHWQLPGLQSIAPILGVVVLGGVAARLSVLVLGLLKLRRLRRASFPVSELAESRALLEEMRASLEARAEFRLSADVDSPVTFGFSTPLILLPERFASLDPRFQSAIACHELLHVRRRDWAHHLAEEFLGSLFWFHPAIAWLISRIRLAREQVVDLEVVRLSQERRTYLDALLEFTNVRAFIAAIPAPPFLAERQLVERIALMVKEVRMSRGRLFVSLAAVSCCLLLVISFAARLFPLKAAPRPAQDSVQKDVAGRVSGGIAKGVADGVAHGILDGIAGGVSGRPSAALAAHDTNGGAKGKVASGATQSRSNSSSDIPNVDISTIWTDTVKRGPMLRQTRGLGQLIRAENSSDLIARVTVPEPFAADLRPGENATIQLRPNQNAGVDARNGKIKGHVIRVSPTPSVETQTVDIAMDASGQPGVSAGLQIVATIDIEKLDDVLQVGRPVSVPANDSSASVSGSAFKIVNDGQDAERVVVKFGRASVNTIEVLDGLQAGDKIILSDMSAYDSAYRVHLTNQMHLGKQ
jgi:beta-lactamase regulating signal transducer with metallopeptidase domain